MPTLTEVLDVLNDCETTEEVVTLFRNRGVRGRDDAAACCVGAYLRTADGVEVRSVSLHYASVIEHGAWKRIELPPTVTRFVVLFDGGAFKDLRAAGVAAA